MGKHTETACFVLGGIDSPMVLDIIFSSVRLLSLVYVGPESAHERHSTIVIYMGIYIYIYPNNI